MICMFAFSILFGAPVLMAVYKTVAFSMSLPALPPCPSDPPLHRTALHHSSFDIYLQCNAGEYAFFCKTETPPVHCGFLSYPSQRILASSPDVPFLRVLIPHRPSVLDFPASPLPFLSSPIFRCVPFLFPPFLPIASSAVFSSFPSTMSVLAVVPLALLLGSDVQYPPPEFCSVLYHSFAGLVVTDLPLTTSTVFAGSWVDCM